MRIKKLLFILLLIVAGIGLSFLAETHPMLPGDAYVQAVFRNKSLTFLGPFMSFISFFGYLPGILLSVFVASVLFIKEKYYTTLVLVWFSVTNNVVNLLVKDLVHRPRPATILAMHFGQSNYGFPSGHVTHYVVFFGFLFYVLAHKKVLPKMATRLAEVFFALLILLIGISRIYLGAHWLSDVIGGYILGLVLLMVLIGLYHRLETNNLEVSQ